MPSYDTLVIQNENALAGYPFEARLAAENLIVDAKFTQFDNFTPVLNSFFVDATNISFNITFDFGTIESVKFYKARYDQGAMYRFVRIYQPITRRYLGTLSFGEGAEEMWNNYAGRTFSINSKFASSSVRGVPLKDAVYTVNGLYGDVAFSSTTDDETVFYNTNTEQSQITFNAVYPHDISKYPARGLRQINLVKPLNNNITLSSNDVIKFTSFNSSSIDVALVTGNSNTGFSVPTLNS